MESTSSEQPDATSPGTQPRRRLTLKRALKILAAIFLFVALLVFATLVYLRSEAFNRLVADQVKTKLKDYGLRGEIGGTKISLKNQTARLSDLKIYNDQTGQLIASARLIELDVDLREPYALKLSREIILRRLNLEGLDFNLEIDEKGGTNLRGLRSVQEKEGGRITLDYSQLLATISNSSIHIKDRANKFGTDLSGIQITARPQLTDNFNVALQLETAGGRFSFQNRETAIDRLGMTGTFFESGAAIDQLNLKAGIAEATANGKIDNWKSLHYGFNFNSNVKLDEVARLLLTNTKMTGLANAVARIEGDGATFAIKGDLKSDEMAVANVKLRGAQIAQFNLSSPGAGQIDIASGRVRANSMEIEGVKVGSIAIDNFRSAYKDKQYQASASGSQVATVEWPKSKLSNISLGNLAFTLATGERGPSYQVKTGARINQGAISGITFTDTTAQAIFDNSALVLNGIKAVVLGGSVAGDLTLPLTRGAAVRAKASFTDLRTRDVFSAVANNSDQVEKVPLAGKISGEAEISIAGADLHSLNGTIATRFDGKTGSANETDAGTDAIPVAGRAFVKAQNGVFDISELEITTDASKLKCGGKLQVDGESDLRFTLTSTQAEQLLQIARSIDAARPYIAEYEPQVFGDFKFDGRVSGRTENAVIEGDLTAGTVGLRDALLGALSGHLLISPAEIRVDNGMISAASGSLKFNLDTPLDVKAESGKIDAIIDRIDLETIVAAAGSPSVSQFITGNLSGEAHLTGLPAKFDGTALISLVGGRITNQEAKNATVSLKFSDRNVELERLDLLLAESHLTASGGLNLADYSFKLQGKTEQVSLQSLVDAFELKDTQVDGTASVDLVVSGKMLADSKTDLDWKSLKLNLIAQGKDVKINGRDAGVLGFGARTEGGRLTFGVVTGILSTSSTSDRPERLRGSIDLDKPGRPITIVGNMINQNIAPLVELLAPTLKVNIEGTLSGRLRIEGPTVDENGNATYEKLHGGLTLSKIDLQVEETPVKIETPLTIELDAMQLKVSSTRITGPGFDLSFNGKLGLVGEAGMDFSLKGNANLGQLPTFDSGLTLTGTMAIDAQASGTAQEPRLAGKVDVKQFGMTSKSLPVIIADGAGSLMLAGDRLTLGKFTAKINDGTLEVNGQSQLEKMQPSEWRFNIKARNAVINYQDIAATANGDLTLNGNQQRQTLGGTITIPQAEYAPRIDLDNLITGGSTGLGSGGVGIGGAGLRRSGIPPIDLNIRLDATNSVVVQNKQINAVGSAMLTLAGTLTNQDVIGRIESDSGTVRFRGQRYDITSGSIDFPPGAGEPQLNLTAESDISNYRVTIGFVGPVNAIELTLQSEPQLSRDELVALITTGREELGTMTSQDLLRTGVGGAASLVTSGFIAKPTEELLGISRFTIDPVIRPNENPAARLTIGQQFSRNLYLSYSTNLSSEQDQTALAEYTLTSRFSALASFTQGGINSATPINNNVFTIELRGRKRFSLGFITGGTVSPAGKGPAANANRSAAPKLPSAAVSVNQVDDLNLKDRKLRELLPVMNQGFSHSLARLGESRLREYLQDQGYFFAEVDYRCEPEDCSGDNLKVYYDVQPYQKYDLEEIRIVGTNQIKLQDVKEQLQSQTASRVGGIPFLKSLPLVGGYVRGLTSNDRLRNDAETIRRSLRDMGFRNAAVQSRWAVRPDSDSLVVIFDVIEGPQAVIAGINLRGNNVLSAEELQQVIPIRRGEAFSRSRARAGVQEITQLYQRHGFLEAKASLEIVDTPEEGVLLVYNIDENSRAVVREIEITGLTKTSESIVRHYLDFREGDVLTPAKIRQTQRDLYATNSFREVTITSDQIPGEDKSAHKVTVKLAEAKPLLFVYGLGYSTDDGLRGLIQLTDANVLGTLDSLSLRTRASRLEQFSQLSFTELRPFGWRLPTTISAFYDRNSELRPFVQPRVINADGSIGNSSDNTDLGIQRFAAFIQTQRRLGERTSLRFRYNLERAKLFGLAADSLPESEVTRNERATRLGMLSFGFTHEARDSILNPTRGYIISMENSSAADFLGGNESFNKFFGSFQAYKTLDRDFPLLKNSTFAFSARLGLAKMFRPTDRNGNGQIDESEQLLPITERFFTGGATTLRGFRFEAAGPQAVVVPHPDKSCSTVLPPCELPVLVPVGGDALAVFNFELRYPLTENFRLVPFYDLGNAFRQVKDINFSNMTNSVGLGLRFITPIGPVGVDYGFLLDPPVYVSGTGAIIRQPRGAFHIRFGQSF